MKTKGCPCGSKTSWCYIEDGYGIIKCRECGRILENDAAYGCEDLPNSTMMHTRQERKDYSLKGGYSTALQRKKCKGLLSLRK